MAIGRPPSTIHDKNNEIRRLKDRIVALNAEIADINKLEFIEKRPDPYYSFSGYYIIRKWLFYNGITPLQGEILCIMSFYNYFVREDCRIWNIYMNRYDQAMESLVRSGYVVYVKMSIMSRKKVKGAWTLTQRGRDIQADYEKYYYEMIDNMLNNQRPKKIMSRFYFDDGQYFRKIRKTKREKKAQFESGKMPIGRQKTESLVKDAYPEGGESQFKRPYSKR